MQWMASADDADFMSEMRRGLIRSSGDMILRHQAGIQFDAG
jgi:hypothetical protein